MRLTVEQYKRFGEICKKIRKSYPYVSDLQVERQAYKIMESETKNK